jgi:hypothetical protein
LKITLTFDSKAKPIWVAGGCKLKEASYLNYLDPDQAFYLIDASLFKTKREALKSLSEAGWHRSQGTDVKKITLGEWLTQIHADALSADFKDHYDQRDTDSVEAEFKASSETRLAEGIVATAHWVSLDFPNNDVVE